MFIFKLAQSSKGKCKKKKKKAEIKNVSKMSLLDHPSRVWQCASGGPLSGNTLYMYRVIIFYAVCNFGNVRIKSILQYDNNDYNAECIILKYTRKPICFLLDNESFKTSNLRTFLRRLAKQSSKKDYKCSYYYRSLFVLMFFNWIGKKKSA